MTHDDHKQLADVDLKCTSDMLYMRMILVKFMFKEKKSKYYVVDVKTYCP